jgi:hypothetical protein
MLFHSKQNNFTMKKYTSLLLLCLFVMLTTQEVKAGNPDRQGEAGAYELVMNPWAGTAGLHGMIASRARGVQAMRINAAGLGHIGKTELAFSRGIYLQGTGIYQNAVGFGQRVSKNGVIGISLMSLDFGDIPVTTTDLPEGTGGTYSPSFFNLGLSYAHTFEQKISVGFVTRIVSETIADVSAMGVALDAGIQYVTGPNDNIHFGISLRNVGTPMRFNGEGLAFTGVAPNSTDDYPLTLEQRSAKFEMPSMLHIGGSYDFLFGENRITAIGNFTSNSFGRDYIGGGIEYAFKEMVMLRGGYRHETGGKISDADVSVYTGLSAGLTVEVPMSKKSDTKLALDYAYLASNPFQGTHNLGIRINL